MTSFCINLFVIIQVLYAAKRLTDSIQEQIWGYFSQTMVPCITKYQMQCIQAQQQLAKEDIEDFLIQGVHGVETSKVSVQWRRKLAILRYIIIYNVVYNAVSLDNVPGCV